MNITQKSFFAYRIEDLVVVVREEREREEE
jgi:hypothetical protein